MRHRRIAELEAAVAQLKSLEQSAGTEKNLVVAELELSVLRDERDAERSKTALILFNSYFKNGCMRVMHPSTVILEGEPYDKGSPITTVWNVRAEAERLSREAVP